MSGYVKPAETNPKPVPKRLIVCCDGTWQSANHATHEIPSNVAKIARAVSKTYVNEDNLYCPQIVYYDAGVATADIFDSKLSGYFGSGLDENVCEAYNFLANNYCDGDEVFFFGFSRGAYTARACAGLVANVGLCKDIQMSRFWEMYTVYKSKPRETPIGDTEWGKKNDAIATKDDKYMKPEDWITISKGDKTMAPYAVRKGAGAGWLEFCKKPVIKIVGVFDTVGSLGYPVNIFVDLSKWNEAYQFHDTDIHPEIENAFQALALDERRAPFSPTLWNMPGDNKKTNLIQCWFPGIHVNIGGGSSDGLKKTPKGDLESMANTTFAWMVDRCRPFLHFDDKVLLFILDKYYQTLQTLTDREIKGGSHSSEKETVGWGSVSTTPPDSHEFIHPVVFHAQDEQGYASRALEGFKRVPGKEEDAHGKGHVWVKTYTKQEAESWKQSWSGWVDSLFNRRTIKKTEESVTITIPEFVIPKMVVQQNSKAPGRYYANPLERLLIIRDLWTEEQTRQAFESEDSFVHHKTNILAKQTQNDYLMKLDEDNKATKYIGEYVAWGTPVQDAPRA
ncbi:hypothetical protein G7Y79_00072g097540 [Physcia stellaris]|nr:hypothetical protein G7Y79_00072g097540 [Physcia stellaris]